MPVEDYMKNSYRFEVHQIELTVHYISIVTPPRAFEYSQPLVWRRRMLQHPSKSSFKLQP